MNFENTPLQVSNKFLPSKSLCVKAAALSLTLLLGACASTGDKVDAVAPAPAMEKAPKAEQQASEPAPTAAELMKTLKAPLVEPPGEEKKVVQSKPVKVKPEKQIQKPQEKVREAEAAVKTEAAKLDAVKVEAAKVEAVVDAKVEKIATAPVQKSPEPVIAETVKISPTGAQPFNVSASKLPFTYDIWTIRKGNTPLTQGLVIATPTWEMGKEGYMSQIWLTLMEDKIHVNSSSDIETASKGLGIRIDGGDLIPFTSIAEKNIGVITGKWLNKLALANKVDVYLGFFPGKKPTSDTFKSDLSLDNLARMVATYRALNQ
tara:strand:- start:135528 stop:136481 length:954 start_codon:yes stop_codon:yes gene_type:complete